VERVLQPATKESGESGLDVDGLSAGRDGLSAGRLRGGVAVVESRTAGLAIASEAS
jgi:hypothetical protein